MRIRWRGLELPSQVSRDESVSTNSYGRFTIEPFEQGFGTTIGNSLRRVLLSSLEGAAITSVKIDGVAHEFSTIEGVLEDVTDILLNIKGVVLKLDGADEKTIRVERDEPGDVCAGDFVTDPSVSIENHDHHIATLTSKVRFAAEMTVRTGRGFSLASDHREAEQVVGVIPIDAVYSPVTRVRYRTEAMRVGQLTNYDRLIMEIWTKGTVRPEDALVEAGLILRKHLNPIVMYHELNDQMVSTIRALPEPETPERTAMDELLNKGVSTLNLSVRASNCLEAARIQTLRDLVQRTEADLLRVRSFGKTSLHEVQRKLADAGLSLGMRLGGESDAKAASTGGSEYPASSDDDAADSDADESASTGPMEVFTMGD